MSASLTPTVAAAPTTTATATGLLAMMAALTGQATDYNQGSQIRTLAESIGAVVAQEGVAGQALALQALAYGAMSLFGIQPPAATFSTVPVIFATSMPVSSAPNAPQAVAIPSGTLVQTNGGVQFATTAAATLASGTNSITVGAVATTAGSIGNIASGAITGAPLTSIGYPLYVTNATAAVGGANAGSPSTSLALFTAKVASLGLSSPVAIANAVVGVTASGTGETVAFAGLYEPWVAAGSGAGSGTAGFTLYVDNGAGNSSAALLAAVQAWITGSNALNQSGYRPAGVPFTVSGATAVYATVGVSGTLLPGLFPNAASSVTAAITSSVQAYFNSIGIAPAAAYQPRVAASVADAGMGAFSSLTVSLFYSGSATAVPVVSGSTGTRVILSSLSVNVSVGS